MKGLLSIEDLNLPQDFIFVEELPETTQPTCTICSDCCLCETGGV